MAIQQMADWGGQGCSSVAQASSGPPPGWYTVPIVKRCLASLLSEHYICHTETDILLALSSHKVGKQVEEQRLMDIWKQVDLVKNFYFSCWYHLTLTLQHNLTRSNARRTLNDRFAWNYHMMTRAFQVPSMCHVRGTARSSGSHTSSRNGSCPSYTGT
ncbi:hypothetical protein PsYK624_116140 [Phanerochaete sordida]|uniref:SAC domain-containing protein n=1 Tax=Phanerochaete sordida TaxID=48140 RepID=A0A9P3GKY3_9APHY|nr:hypothetical protein PsYK624_116140 [Phanerochaete sordida]